MIYTVREVAAQLKVEENQVYRWLKDGSLKGIKLGKKKYLWRVSQENIDEFLKLGEKNEK